MKLFPLHCVSVFIIYSITQLRSLEVLDLSDNIMSAANKSLSKELPALTSVKNVDLSRCSLTELPWMWVHSLMTMQSLGKNALISSQSNFHLMHNLASLVYQILKSA